jgi:hypothetical protein
MSPSINTICQDEETRTFYLFPQLPKELQLQIWESAISSRICDLVRYYVPSSDLERAQRRSIKGFKAEPPAPSILHACTEARQVAMKYYSIAFKYHYMTFVKRLYIDFTCDALRIPYVVFASILRGGYIQQSDGVFTRLKYLIVEGPLEYRDCMNAFLVFRGLNRLVVEDPEGEPSLSRRLERIMPGCISMSLNTHK